MNRAPAAFGFTNRTRVTLYTRKGNTFTHIREIFQMKGAADGSLSISLPFCPTKWIGTRACAICRTFTDFRPVRVKITWQPTVGTSESGSVCFGTVFSGARLPTATDYAGLSQSLTISNGGFMTTIWKPHSRFIDVGRNLRANNFPMYDVQPDDIPFWIVGCTSKTANEILGNVVVEADLSLKNPIAGEQIPPVAGAGEAVFTHTDASGDTPASTVMKIAKTLLNFEPAAGGDYGFNFTKPLKNVAGNILVPILSTIAASYSTSDATYHYFNVDPQLKSDTANSNVIGRLINFIL